jgi:hypothetical protein
MTTPLHTTLRRALTIDGRDYVVTLTRDMLKLTLKGKRRGVELPWANLVNGEAALAVALHASLGDAATPVIEPRTRARRRSLPARPHAPICGIHGHPTASTSPQSSPGFRKS